MLKQFEAWLNEAGLAFVAIEDVRRTTPAVAAYVGVLDFIVYRERGRRPRKPEGRANDNGYDALA